MYDPLCHLLINQLLSVPFPFLSVLKEQLFNAEVHIETFCDAIHLIFLTRRNSTPLPSFLDICPISWQIVMGDCCIECSLFLNNGYIESLEVIDYCGNPIRYELLAESIPAINTDYTKIKIEKLLQEKLRIFKIRHTQNNIDIGLNDCNTVICFRDCKVHCLDNMSLPLSVQLNLILQENGGTVISTDHSVNFDFSLVYLKYHSRM